MPNCGPEPCAAERRLKGMNRTRWILVAAVGAVGVVLAVLFEVSVLSTDGRASGPPQGRQGLAFDAAYADADPNVLIVRYGDSGSCPSQDVRHNVVEHPDRVVVTLTRKPNTDGRPCTSDYKAELVRVGLKAPLGSREVLDGSREASLPISTGTPPFG